MAMPTFPTTAIASFLLLLLFSAADDRLIELVCHNAEVPEACLRCISSDPGAPKADQVGLAAILVSCLANHAHTLATNMSAIASRSSDRNVTAAFQACSKEFVQARQYLSTATTQLRSGRYDDANNSIRTALENQVSCTDNIDAHKLAMPSPMLYRVRLYQELSEAAMRIIDRF